MTQPLQHQRQLSPSAFVLRLERRDLGFRPGQYIILGKRNSIDRREYTIYSAEEENFLEVLVKEVEGGLVSRALRQCRPGEPLELDGPFGFFTIHHEDLHRGKFLFIATGTGVSPFHCFVKSYPQLDYTLLHGVRYLRDCYDRAVFDPGRYIDCVSREGGGKFLGRVTDYLRQHPVDAASLCYLCGNCDMIYQCFDILRGYGVPSNHLFAEVYF